MKATPSKTPGKAPGGGLFAFGFTKKSPPSSATSNVEKSISSQPSEDEVKTLAVKAMNNNNNNAVMLSEDDEEEVSAVVANPEKRDVVSVSLSTKRTTADSGVGSNLPKVSSETNTQKKSSPRVVNEESSKKSSEEPSESGGKKRRIVLDEESSSDEADKKPAKTSSATKRVETVTPPPKKVSSSQKKARDSDDEFIDDESEADDDDDDSGSEVDEDEESEEEEPKASKKNKPENATKAKTPRKAALASSSTPPPAAATPVGKAGVLSVGEHEHDLLPWFQERKDANQRLPDHPDYDATTLFVPPGYIEGKPAFHMPQKARKITDAMRVWWDFYSKNADCVLAFKVGKFYELYHQCADTAVRLCDLLYMKGETAHCGFPESAWSKNMSKLVNANYRVARVEQTETPDQMEQRTGKKSGMVRREVCQVLSPGTMTLSVRDCGDGFVPRNDGRVQLLAVTESTYRFGVCLLDASTGKFRLGEFDNDEHRVALRACLAFETPAEIVFVKSKLSPTTLAVLESESKALKTVLTVKQVSAVNTDWSRYFNEAPNNVVPDMLQSVEPLANQALAMCVRVLQRALVDDELMTMGRFSKYLSPTAVAAASGNASTSSEASSSKLQTEEEGECPFLKMDSQALRHLEIVANATDGTAEGTLLEYLDRTKSPFGARLFREWVTRPLASVPHILRRQQAVQQFLPLLGDSAINDFRKALQGSPDLERNLSKIHAIGLAKKASHPDSRAVIYGADEVNKNKIETLCATLTALRGLRIAGEKLSTCLAAASTSSSSPPSPYLLSLLAKLTEETSLKTLDHFEQAFDARQAKRTGSIEPREGVSPRYDAGLKGVADAKAGLNTYLAQIKKQMGTQLTYFCPSTGKQRFQIEVAESFKVPSDWTMCSKRKGFKRYLTPQLKNLVLQLERAEVALAEASVDVTRTVFEEFDKHKMVWLDLVRSAAELDCLLSLAMVSGGSGVEMCVPEFISSSTSPRLDLEQARHPCVAAGLDRLGKDSFIPNDTSLNEEQGRCMLLTGPNMGGKSTLLRQTCLAVIVAQMGCLVQARSYRGTIVDAIFTRVGASDRILEGQSTFFVELSETATILRSATKNSLVILDELGRGTSTFDGTAIAHAVINKLLSIGCRTMFATHYHSLVREVGKSKGVSLGHMACVAEGDSKDADKQDVTFLYKLQPGASDRSYGLNVARLARLPESIIKRAHLMSTRFEKAFERHLRAKLVEEIAELEAKRDVKRLRFAVYRAECFVE